MSLSWDANALEEVYARMVRSGADFVVVGGQAVNLWAEHYRQAGAFPAEVWTNLLPFASYDLDCLGGSLDAQAVGQDFGVKPQVYAALGKAWTPSVADLRLPVAGRELLLQFLHTVKGLSTSEVEENARELTCAGVILRVQHPAQCLEGKLANLCDFSQERPPRQDLKHARLSTLILHAFVRERLAAGKVREVLGWVERIARLARGQYGLKTWYEHGLDITEAVPLAALRSAAATGEPKMANFMEHRWEQLRTMFTVRRDHFDVIQRQQGHERRALRSLLPPLPAASGAPLRPPSPDSGVKPEE